MAVISTAVGVGGAILVPLVGWGIDNHGWRSVAMVSGIGLLVFVWPLVLTIRHRPEDVGLLPDGDKPLALDETGAPLVDGDTSVPTFVEEVEYTISDAFKTKAMWILILGITLRFTSHTAIMVHLSPILEAQGMSTTKSAAAIGLLVFLSIPGRLICGALGDKFPKHKVVSGFLILQVLALVVLLNADTMFELYLFIVLWAAAYGAGILNWAIVGDYFGRGKFATLRGLMGLFYSGGAVVGPVYAGWVFDQHGNYTQAVGVFLVVTTLSVISFWFCKPPPVPSVN